MDTSFFDFCFSYSVSFLGIFWIVGFLILRFWIAVVEDTEWQIEYDTLLAQTDCQAK